MEELRQSDINFERGFAKGFAGILVLIGVILMWIFFSKVSTHFDYGSPKDSADMAVTGQVGDFIGGVVGTLFSLAGVFLLFQTLSSQREFFKKEMFEQRFFELIKLHRDVVFEFCIADTVKGRSTFKYMINELRFIYRIVEVGALAIKMKGKETTVNSNLEYLKMAYLIMFFGIGYSSERQLNELFNDDQREIFDEYVKKYLESVQDEYEKLSPSYKSHYFTYLLPITGIPDGLTFETVFYPFDGHTSRLGHYYRILFQTVNYVDSQPLDVLSKEDKYSYIKTLRAMLSNQEQLLLFYNALSILGSEWINDGLIKKYALIKNMPLAIVDIGVHPRDVFGIKNDDGRYLFETDEILARNNNKQ